jgi:3,4-dihydroxy 2-butanone 4-phosphate synthase/GTP cyclohydrolase II
VAIDGTKGRDHIVTPGHVFPLVAKPGGVLVRAGHTEAAVDVSRLAGLNPSGVICEIMNEDGTMARLDDLIAFAQLHGLKIGTIRDLIAYRRRHNHNIERVAEARFTSRYGGEWTAITFRNTAIDTETLALVKGHIDLSEPTLVRMHALGVFTDALGLENDWSSSLGQSMEAIAKHGSGVLVLLSPQERLSQTTRYVAGEKLPVITDLRDYGVGAQILAELGVHDMILLTNSQRTPIALGGYGLNIVEKRAF